MRFALGLDGSGRRRPRLIWCISQELPGQASTAGEPNRPHTQLEELKRWLPDDTLHGGNWQAAYSPSAYTLRLKNGCRIVFKSYDQDLLAFESAAVDLCWFDEEPTCRALFTSCLLRLVDRRGWWLMTLTPVQSLQGKVVIAEELWEHREAGARGESPYGTYATFQLFTSDNPHLPVEEVAALQHLPDEEKAVRLSGAFARLGGRVLSEFDPARHLVADFLPSPDWRHYLIIDPGWRTAAHLFAAVDPDGRVWLYGEYYQGERRPEEHMAVLHSLWGRVYGRPRYDVLMDPAGFSIKRTTTGRESPSDADEYRAAAERLGADWFQVRPASNADPYAWRVKRYLAADLIRVCRGMRWWLWEQERWTRQREHEGAMAQERPVPDAPIDRFNHMMDNTRYLCNLLPDPLPLPADPRRDPVAEHWKAALAEVAEPERGRTYV